MIKPRERATLRPIPVPSRLQALHPLLALLLSVAHPLVAHHPAGRLRGSLQPPLQESPQGSLQAHPREYPRVPPPQDSNSNSNKNGPLLPVALLGLGVKMKLLVPIKVPPIWRGRLA